MKRRFQSGAEAWTAERKPGGWAGVVSDGFLPPAAEPPALLFCGPYGSRKVLLLNAGTDPSLDECSDDMLVEFLSRAV